MGSFSIVMLVPSRYDHSCFAQNSPRLPPVLPFKVLLFRAWPASGRQRRGSPDTKEFFRGNESGDTANSSATPPADATGSNNWALSNLRPSGQTVSPGSLWRFNCNGALPFRATQLCLYILLFLSLLH